MGSYYEIERTNAIYHHGIKGQKWGVRRYQNPDGSLTEAGKRRYMDKNGNLTDKGKKLINDTYQKQWEQYQDEVSAYNRKRVESAQDRAFDYANSRVDAINAKLDKKYPKYADGTLDDDDDLWRDIEADFGKEWDKEYDSKISQILLDEQKIDRIYISNLQSKKNAEKLINEYGMTKWSDVANGDAVFNKKTGMYEIT